VKLLLAIALCFLFLTGCSEPQEHSPPQPTTNITTVQQQQQAQEQQQEEDASTDAAVQASIDMMMSVATQ
jgi:PBP1b-binding outer membrane lipoprotein LpoB